MPALAHVVPLTPVDGVFTYVVRDELIDEAVPGARVVVPFGRRRLTGIVVERGGGEADGLKAIEDVLDAVPALPEDLLTLTKWIADYYVCSWGEVLKPALPSGTAVESRRVV